MDFQHRAGGKTGTGGVASASDANRDRRERLRMLALETIDLMKVSIVLKISVNKVTALVNKLCGNFCCCFITGSIFYEKSFGFI